MLRIILVRHGQTEWNKDAHFRGRIDIKLNPTGITQAQSVADQLASLQISAVYASPLKRAIETAAPIAAAQKLEVIPFAGLLDIDYGQWGGRQFGEVAEQWPGLYRQWDTTPHLVRIPGGESLDDVLQRVRNGLEKILQDHDQ